MHIRQAFARVMNFSRICAGSKEGFTSNWSGPC